MNKGFTLAELLIIVTILAIVAICVALPIAATVSDNGSSSGSAFDWCDLYKYSPAHQVPIGCYQKFNIQPGMVPYVIPR